MALSPQQRRLPAPYTSYFAPGMPGGSSILPDWSNIVPEDPSMELYSLMESPQARLDLSKIAGTSGFPMYGDSNIPGPGTPPPKEPSMWDKFVGTKENPGWGGLAIGGANSLLQGYLGMRQYQLGKKSLAENQRQFNLNYANQAKLTNASLEDRQRARVASGNSTYESVDSYMAKNRI